MYVNYRNDNVPCPTLVPPLNNSTIVEPTTGLRQVLLLQFYKPSIQFDPKVMNIL
jgi:hypothetical protein